MCLVIKHHKGVTFTQYFINEEKETELCHIYLVNGPTETSSMQSNSQPL